MAEVILENVVKAYRDRDREVRAVDGIDLSVQPGEFMVLVGPSGCGKSTTLRLIAGLEEITSGSISIAGRRINDVPPRDRDIAMVFQNYALYPHLSVYDNMAFGLKMRKFPAAEIARRVREAAAMLGLAHCLDRKPKALSGGQRQRVAVGRAIVRQPKVFLFDEPLSNLDARMRGDTRAELAALHARLGATMIYVTHDQVEAMTMGDRICVMKDGRILQVDGPIALYQRPQNVFVGGFIGSPPMNFFRGTLRRHDSGLRFVETPNAGSAPAAGLSLALHPAEAARLATRIDSEIILGFRPESLALRSAAAAFSPMGEAVVNLSEPMGAETHVHLASGSTKFIVRTRPTDRFPIGDKVPVAADPTATHFFDPATEERID